MKLGMNNILKTIPTGRPLEFAAWDQRMYISISKFRMARNV